jgi:hypothetical protein
MFKPTVVADGEIAGTWRRTRIGGEVLIEPLLWNPLRGKLRDALVEAAGAYGAFLGRPTRLT